MSDAQTKAINSALMAWNTNARIVEHSPNIVRLGTQEEFDSGTLVESSGFCDVKRDAFDGSVSTTIVLDPTFVITERLTYLAALHEFGHSIAALQVDYDAGRGHLPRGNVMARYLVDDCFELTDADFVYAGSVRPPSNSKENPGVDLGTLTP
jgi:FAD/FMN-containing dehydrogenase